MVRLKEQGGCYHAGGIKLYDEDYFNKAVKRVSNHQKQERLFT